MCLSVQIWDTIGDFWMLACRSRPGQVVRGVPTLLPDHNDANDFSEDDDAVGSPFEPHPAARCMELSGP